MFVTSIVILIKRIYYSHNLKSNFPVFFSLCIYRTKIQFKQNMAFEDYIYIGVHSPFSYLFLRVYNIMPLNVKFSVFQWFTDNDNLCICTLFYREFYNTRKILLYWRHTLLNGGNFSPSVTISPNHSCSWWHHWQGNLMGVSSKRRHRGRRVLSERFVKRERERSDYIFRRRILTVNCSTILFYLNICQPKYKIDGSH